MNSLCYYRFTGDDPYKIGYKLITFLKFSKINKINEVDIMTKNISNKLKTLLTLGVVTITTASSIFPVSALSRNNCVNIKVKSNLYLYINGVKYKLHLNPSCPIKPEFKPNNNNNNSVNKPNNDNNTANFSSYQKQVLDLVNAERTKRGLKALTLDTKLSNVATMKSQDMIDKNYFDHNSPTYGSPFDMMKQFGISYRSAGENIA